MLNEIVNATNLEEALEKQIEQSELNRGLFIFLDCKTYELSELTDDFIANRVSFITKKTTPNPLLVSEVKRLGIYGYAVSGNKQIFSTQGLNSVYSQLYTIGSVKDFLSSEKEIKKATRFFTEGFTSSFIDKNFKKAFKLPSTKENKKEVIKKEATLIAGIKNQYVDTLKVMEKQARTTLEIVQINKAFIEAIIAKLSQKQEAEMKTIRLNVIVSDDKELSTLEDESYLYFYRSLFAYQNIYQNQEAYFYSAISANYNDKKRMMYLNRAEAPNVGNELLGERDLKNHISVYLYIRALAQSSKGPMKTFYLVEGRITNRPQLGALRYKILDEKKSYYILDFSPLPHWNTEGARPFDLQFTYYSTLNKKNPLIVTSYQELAKLIFWGSKEKKAGNLLQVDRTPRDNQLLINKYFEGRNLTPTAQKIYDLLVGVGAYEEDVAKLPIYLQDLRQDVLRLSQYENQTLEEAMLKYKNTVSFWDTLLEIQAPKFPEKIVLDSLENDTDYLLALVKTYLALYKEVNRSSSKTATRPTFTAVSLNKLVHTTRYSLLLDHLIQYHKSYHYVYLEANKKYRAKQAEEDPTLRAKDLKDKFDYFSEVMEYLKKYQVQSNVVSDQTLLIYAVLAEVKIELKEKKEKEES